MLSIKNKDYLNVEYVSERMDLNVYYGSSNFRYDNNIVIRESSPQKEWQDFAHECGHYILHVGNQFVLHPLFCQLQEWQADRFAYHFCVPTFMLLNLKEVSVDVIMSVFNVEYDFALRRFEMYQNKVLLGGVL